MTDSDSDREHTGSWGGDCRERGVKLVVAVVDDAVSDLLHKAAHAATTEEWADGRRVHEPGSDGIARVLVTSIYQDLLGFGSNLMIFDPTVADEEAWDVLCDYFSECGPARERILLLRPLSLPHGVSDKNVTTIRAPEKLTVEFLRQQIMDAPQLPDLLSDDDYIAEDDVSHTDLVCPDANAPRPPRQLRSGDNMLEATLMLQIDHYESFAPSSSRLLMVRSGDQGDCYAAKAAFGPWLKLPDQCAEAVGDWVKVLSAEETVRLLDEYSAKCRHEQWTPHPDTLTIGLTVDGHRKLHWMGNCGRSIQMADLPEGIISDYISAMQSMSQGECPLDVPVSYLNQLSDVSYAGEGRSASAAMADIVSKAHLAVWAEHRHDWWSMPEVGSSAERLELLIKILEANGVNWRDGLSPDEIADAERVLRSHRLLT